MSPSDTERQLQLVVWAVSEARLRRIEGRSRLLRAPQQNRSGRQQARLLGDPELTGNGQGGSSSSEPELPRGREGMDGHAGDGSSPGPTTVDRQPIASPPTGGPAAAFVVDWQVGEIAPGSGTPDSVGPGSRPAVPAVDGLVPPGEGDAGRGGLTLAVGRAMGTVVVTARGVLDVAGSRLLEGVLRDLIDNQGNLAVVVDLHEVTDADSGCLDVFVAAHGWARLRGGQVILAGAQNRVVTALEVAGVARLIRVTADRILAVPAPTAGPAGVADPYARQAGGR